MYAQQTTLNILFKKSEYWHNSNREGNEVLKKSSRHVMEMKDLYKINSS